MYWNIYTHYYTECPPDDRCTACDIPAESDQLSFDSEKLHAHQMLQKRKKTAASGHQVTDEDVRVYLDTLRALRQRDCSMEEDYPYQSRSDSVQEQQQAKVCMGCMKDKVAPVRRCCNNGHHWIFTDVYKHIGKSSEDETEREEYGDEEVLCKVCFDEQDTAAWKEYVWGDDAEYPFCPTCAVKTDTYWRLDGGKVKNCRQKTFLCSKCIDNQKGWRVVSKLKWEPLSACRQCGQFYHAACGLLAEPYMVCAQCRLDNTHFGAGITSCEGGRLEQFLHTRFLQRFRSHSYFVRQLESFVGEVAYDPSEYPKDVKVPQIPIERVVRTIVLVSMLSGMPAIEFIMCVSEYWHGCGHTPTKGCVCIDFVDSAKCRRAWIDDHDELHSSDVYVEIMASYLEFMQKAGFKTAHIWPCPPVLNQAYLFTSKFQLNAKDEAGLIELYNKVFRVCRERRCVLGDSPSSFDEYYGIDTKKGKGYNSGAVPWIKGHYYVAFFFTKEGTMKRLAKSLVFRFSNTTGVISEKYHDVYAATTKLQKDSIGEGYLINFCRQHHLNFHCPEDRVYSTLVIFNELNSVVKSGEKEIPRRYEFGVVDDKLGVARVDNYVKKCSEKYRVASKKRNK